MIVVADAGPLLHLHWVSASRWALPPHDICVVDEVWIEIERHAPDALGDPRLLRTKAPSARPADWPSDLDGGESAAIAFALTQVGALVLCDEMAGREACAKLGLSVTGSVGLILEAARTARVDVPGAVEALEQLPTRGGLHVSRELVERAIRAVRAF